MGLAPFDFMVLWMTAARLDLLIVFEILKVLLLQEPLGQIGNLHSRTRDDLGLGNNIVFRNPTEACRDRAESAKLRLSFRRGEFSPHHDAGKGGWFHTNVPTELPKSTVKVSSVDRTNADP